MCLPAAAQSQASCDAESQVPSVAPPQFELEGLAQWRNITGDGAITTANFGSISLMNDLGIGRLHAGPLVRFIWTPRFKMLRATSKVWVEYGQIDRIRTHNLTETITFAGNTYIVNSTLKTELKTRQFEAGYTYRWGNDKFRVGPSFTYERLDVDFVLTEVGAHLPQTLRAEVDVPNNVYLIGGDFDYTQIRHIDIEGHFGFVPCCGGGWHVFESELRAKYYLI